MDKKKTSWRARALRGAVALTLFGLAGAACADDATTTADPGASNPAASNPAAADPAATNNWGVQVAVGTADHHTHKLDLGLIWDPHLNWWYIGGWHFTLVAEGHAVWWHSDEGNVHENVGEFGATPVFRFIKDSGAIRPYIEAGVGVRLLTSPTISSRYTLSSAFQFADMAGVGLEFGNRQQYMAGFRFQHLSNASIKEPNPGINFTELYLQYNF